MAFRNVEFFGLIFLLTILNRLFRSTKFSMKLKTMVSKAGIGSFGSLSRVQVLLEH